MTRQQVTVTTSTRDSLIVLVCLAILAKYGVHRYNRCHGLDSVDVLYRFGEQEYVIMDYGFVWSKNWILQVLPLVTAI